MASEAEEDRGGEERGGVWGVGGFPVGRFPSPHAEKESAAVLAQDIVWHDISKSPSHISDMFQ